VKHEYPIRDAELHDALREHPDLLAVADAVAATHERPHRPGRRVAALAAALVVALAAGLAFVAPWNSGGVLATEGALAALGERPVIHAVVELADPDSSVLDLSSGESRPVIERVEYWFDSEKRRLRARLSIDGRLETEWVQTPESFAADTGDTGPGRPATLDPGLAGFASRYREALESGLAQVAGETTVDGRDAVLLRFDLPRGGAEEVAVDAADYRPLRFRWSHPNSESQPWWSVVLIETLDADASQFAAPPARRTQPRLGSVTAAAIRTLTPAEAADALDPRPLWPGVSVRGVDVSEILLNRVRAEWRDGRQAESRALELVYGDPPGEGSLVVFVAPSTEETFLFMPGPLPEPGRLRLVGRRGGAGPGREMWFGTLRRDGLTFSFRASSRALVVDAARSLEPF
jgi:hypothetical protein